MPHPIDRALFLANERSAIVFSVRQGYLPQIVHWGPPLGDEPAAAAAAIVATSTPSVMNSSFDTPRVFSVLPTENDGWSGTPGLSGLFSDAASLPQLTLQGVEETGTSVRFILDSAELQVVVVYTLDAAGILAAAATVTAAVDYKLAALRLLLPLPARATEIADLTGRWSRERTPQRLPVVDGTHSRAVRRGRPGHDSPTLEMVGSAGFGFRHGEVWAAHLAWSGDQEYIVERLPEGAGSLASVLGVGELLRPGEINLFSGQSYSTPTALFAWSATGIDELSASFHARVRALPSYPASPRPLVLNTWEAVYFDHNLERLTELARIAARVGVERYVLDDGWFHGRRSDHSSLGDWQIDINVWPDGLTTLSSVVHDLGMQFGLWFEPEMVSLDSDVARQHPDWVINAGGLEWRHQQVLDLNNPDAFAYVLDNMSAIIAEASVDFVKWDHNRDVHGATSVHAQTLAAYALIDALLDRHPGLEIESCASGGGRVDLGILERTHRIWPSDTNDPVERQQIQRWTGLIVPPELVGTHVGSGESHTTHRVTSLGFRLATALFGHAGIEWDLTSTSEDDLEAISAWSALYRRLRPLLHSGTTVRVDLPGGDALWHGVVSPDRTSALFCWAQLGTQPLLHSERVRFDGLDRDRRYRVALLSDLGEASRHQVADPAWLDSELIVPGSVLLDAGLPLPVLNPGQALLLELEAV